MIYLLLNALDQSVATGSIYNKEQLNVQYI